MNKALLKTEGEPTPIERALIAGDLSQLKPEERLGYYKSVCESLGLNPLTKPFAYITLNGKLTLYALKDCTEQLRKVHSVSVTIKARESVEGCYIVTASAKLPNGRVDESIGSVPIEGLKGENRSNAMMKAETKAKRRVTLSICGMGILDETEVSSIKGAETYTEEQLAEQAVKKAIENRADTSGGFTATATMNGQPIDVEVTTTVVEDEIPGITHPKREEPDWREVECHIGKANGKLLGFKVGEFDMDRLKYLRDRFADPLLSDEIKLQAATKKDVQLAQAVKAAIHFYEHEAKPESEASPQTGQTHAQEAAVAPISAPEGKDSTPALFDWRIVTIPFECKVKGEPLEKMSDGHLRAIQKAFIAPMDTTKATPEEKRFKVAFELALAATGAHLNVEQIRAGLRDFAENNLMTEPQFMKFLADNVAEIGASLDTADEDNLRRVYRMRDAIRELIDTELKPKVAEKPTKPKAKRGAKAK